MKEEFERDQLTSTSPILTTVITSTNVSNETDEFQVLLDQMFLNAPSRGSSLVVSLSLLTLSYLIGSSIEIVA